MTIPVWIAFLVFVVTMVALDLGVFHRKDKVITIRELSRGLHEHERPARPLL
jgi:hypothetical protein